MGTVLGIIVIILVRIIALTEAQTEPVDTVTPVIDVCPSDIVRQIELGDPDPVITWRVPMATDLGGEVTVFESHSSGSSFPPGMTTVNYAFTDAASNSASCTFVVTINTAIPLPRCFLHVAILALTAILAVVSLFRIDTTPPIFYGCPVVFQFDVELGMPGSFPTWLEPTATDLSGSVVVSASRPPGSFFPVGDTNVTYTFRDESGNTVQCRFIIRVTTKDTTPPTIMGCQQTVGIRNTWQPSHVGGTIGKRFVTCQSDSQQDDKHFLLSRNHSSVDTTPPTISCCPVVVLFEVELGKNGSFPTWIEPTATDLSGSVVVSATSTPGSFFPVGDTEVIYTFVDDSDNTAQCHFIVTTNISKCDATSCDNTTTNCVNANGGFTCECHTGLVKDPVSPRTCISGSNGGVQPGIIVGSSIIIAAIIILLLVFVGILLKKNRDLKKALSPSETHYIDVSQGQANEVSMELEETNRMQQVNEGNREIPRSNVILDSILHSKGQFEYHKAMLIRKIVVVKKLSANAPVRLAIIQTEELEKISALPYNKNVVRFLGFCSNVPILLVFEFVNGKNLMEYLEENFEPNKIHKYNNIKRKQFPVPERGSVESLPIFALHIARGMNFLTAHKFIHPGLRAEKVIIDVEGQCKLYDFVSEENAKAITDIRWKEHVPYQWMPPEYLFLKKLHTSGDVWSFGILLWQIFSFGAQPYVGNDRNTVEKEIREKRHLKVPNNCPGAIWQLALNCWEDDHERRPSFEKISIKLSTLCFNNEEYEQVDLELLDGNISPRGYHPP